MKPMRLRPDVACIAGVCLLLIFGVSSVYAQEFSIHGFLQGNFALGTEASNPDGKDFKWAEERVQLKLEDIRENLRIFVKTDLSFDNIDKIGNGEIREAYAEVSAQKWDLRAGRQIITWGLGDLLFINDVFPKDYEAFFSGRPVEYLKTGVDSLNAGIYPEGASFELVIIPFFEPDNLPNPERFWTFDPMPAVTDRVESEPASNLRNAEVGLRVYGNISDLEVSLYVYKGFYRQPSMLPDSFILPTRITLVYPELSVYGISLQKGALGGIMGLEAGYYDSREDRAGRDPFIPNSQTRLLLIHQRQIFEDFNAALQYYGEYMRNHREYEKTRIAGFPKEPEFRQIASLRMTYLLMHQNLKLEWFSFWSPTDKDYMLNPEIRYNFSDHLWLAIGWNAFGGNSVAKRFGSLDKNDNIYLETRYEF